MVDPDGTLDALASLGLSSPSTPTQPHTAKTTSSCAASVAPPAKEPLPEIPPGPVAPTARVQAPPAGAKEIVRDPGRGVGGLPFNRMRPSGEEAIMQK